MNCWVNYPFKCETSVVFWHVSKLFANQSNVCSSNSCSSLVAVRLVQLQWPHSCYHSRPRACSVTTRGLYLPIGISAPLLNCVKSSSLSLRLRWLRGLPFTRPPAPQRPERRGSGEETGGEGAVRCDRNRTREGRGEAAAPCHCSTD